MRDQITSSFTSFNGCTIESPTLSLYWMNSYHSWHKYSPCGDDVSRNIARSKGQKSRSHRSFEILAMWVIAVSPLWFRIYRIDSLHMRHKYKPRRDYVSRNIFSSKGQRSRSHGSFDVCAVWGFAVSGLCDLFASHYTDVTMSLMASQMTSLGIVYSTVHLGADQRKHQSTASLTFVWRIHRGPVNSPHKRPVTRKMFPFDDVIMIMWQNATHYRTMYYALFQIKRSRSHGCLLCGSMPVWPTRFISGINTTHVTMTS